MIQTTAGSVRANSPWLQPLPVEFRGPLAGRVIIQTDGQRTIVREKPGSVMRKRRQGFTGFTYTTP